MVSVAIPAYQTRSSRFFLVLVIVGLLLSALAYTVASEWTPAVGYALAAFFGLTAANLVLYIVSRGRRLAASAGGLSLRSPGARRDATRLLFHLSLLVTLAGGGLSALTRQGTSTRVVDGFYAPLARFLPGETAPICHFIDVSKTEGPDGDKFRYIKGIKTEFAFEKGVVTDVRSVLATNEGRGPQELRLSYNQPADLAGDKLYLSGEGYAASFYFRDVSGGEVKQYLMMFDLEGKRRQFTPYARPVGDGLLVEAVPTVAPEAIPSGANHLLLRMKVTDGAAVVFDGDVPRGAEVLIGSRRLYFEGLYPYVDVLYVRDNGVAVTYAGFLGLILTGSVLMVQRTRTAGRRQPVRQVDSEAAPRSIGFGQEHGTPA